MANDGSCIQLNGKVQHAASERAATQQEGEVFTNSAQYGWVRWYGGVEPPAAAAGKDEG